MILGRRHISFNGVHLPANLAVQELRRTCVPLHFATNDERWPIGNRGSAFLYSYRARLFCVFTRHQLGRDLHASQICIRLTSDFTLVHSGARFIAFAQHPDAPEEHDICAIEMPYNSQNDGLSPIFYKARSPLEAEPSEKHFAIGYPSRLTVMAGELACEGIAKSQVLVWAEGWTQKDNGLPMLALAEGLVMGPKCQGDFDGFSGGPVFGVNLRDGALEFRGITIRAGHDKLFYAPSSAVDRICDLSLIRPPIRLIDAA
jgi:hypothetical protein